MFTGRVYTAALLRAAEVVNVDGVSDFGDRRESAKTGRLPGRGVDSDQLRHAAGDEAVEFVPGVLIRRWRQSSLIQAEVRSAGITEVIQVNRVGATRGEPLLQLQEVPPPVDIGIGQIIARLSAI